MKFGPIPVTDALGTILAHSMALPGGRLRKGHVLEAGDLAALSDAGWVEVIAAQLEPGDVAENEAARRLAAALVPKPDAAGLVCETAFTGRVNIRATGPGVVAVDAARIAAANQVDPMITVATVPKWQRVTQGTMVGTVKIISYGVPGAALEAACKAGADALTRHAPRLGSADLIVTELPGQEAAESDKGIQAVWQRITRLGLTKGQFAAIPHRTDALAKALEAASGDLVLILTGSATSDPADVVPAAMRAAQGHVTRFGMPVDPGNLLVLGHVKDRPVIGLPGCARSPALNGADWVLERIACGVPVSNTDIAAMGVGGLLKEIPSRPQPRAPKT